jgi:hypothetical protein
VNLLHHGVIDTFGSVGATSGSDTSDDLDRGDQLRVGSAAYGCGYAGLNLDSQAIANCFGKMQRKGGKGLDDLAVRGTNLPCFHEASGSIYVLREILRPTRSFVMASLQHARTRGFKAMQFNFVVSTNGRAVRLWQNLGFETAGRLPLAFEHPRHGLVDALVMFRAL